MSLIARCKTDNPNKDSYILRMGAKTTLRFDIYQSIEELTSAGFRLPNKNEEVKMVSPRAGWNAGSIVGFVAKHEPIMEMHASTYRMGTKVAKLLDNLATDKRLSNCRFLLHFNQANDNHRHKNEFFPVAERHGWTYKFTRNHSKVILMKTERNHYVVETSANMNELPNLEVFSICNDKTLYDFYNRWIFQSVWDGVN